MAQDNNFDLLKKALPGIKKNIALALHTTFKVGGPADYFFVAKDAGSVVKAITIAKELKLALLIIGGGSNLLVADDGFRGLVIKIQNTGISLKGDATIVADAGVSMADVVAFSLKNSLKGMEWAGGLPGTFGGAIRGNAGCFGSEIKDFILEAEVLDENLNLKKLSNQDCQFSYRNSIAKQRGWIILSAQLQMQKGDQKALEEIAQSRVDYRKDKHPLEYGSAGSVFKNIDVKVIASHFQDEFVGKIKQDPFPIVPAAWFVIGAGFTGRQIGQAQVSEKHSNYIVNLGGAKASDIKDLIETVQKGVKEKYDIDLEPEVQLVGF